jgi:hypothetical protein
VSSSPRWLIYAVICVAVVSACGGGPTGPSSLADGTWGGEHIAMTIAASTTHLEFDCAHGDIPGVVSLDADGRFTAAGTFVRDRGGPVREGDVPDSHPASYSGSVRTDTMTLSIRLTDTGESVGPFTLTRGAIGRLVKCV